MRAITRWASHVKFLPFITAHVWVQTREMSQLYFSTIVSYICCLLQTKCHHQCGIVLISLEFVGILLCFYLFYKNFGHVLNGHITTFFCQPNHIFQMCYVKNGPQFWERYQWAWNSDRRKHTPPAQCMVTILPSS